MDMVTLVPSGLVMGSEAPPVLTCPSDVQAECTGGFTPVTFSVSAVDFEGSPVPVTCVPPSGSGFRLGETTDVCTATDALGSTSSCTFPVTVVDTTPPQVTCPADITAAASSCAGAVVTYVASCSDSCGLVAFDCSPTSGTSFPVGATTAVCSCTNRSGNQASCSFNVTVTGQGADLSVSKTADLTSVKTGGKLTYTIAVKNEGTEDAGDVVVEDTLPAGVKAESVRTTQGTCGTRKTKKDGTVTCDLGSLPSGASATVTIAVKVKAHGPATITNTATVSSSTPECNTDNNSASVTTSVL